MNALDPEIDDAENILAIYLIINEEFHMSPGKIASQAFQACQTLLAAADNGEANAEQMQLLQEWRESGTRTITKFAPTSHLFARCCSELAGATMVDEGLTEGTCGPTIHATYPLRRGQASRLLRHKRIRLSPSTWSHPPRRPHNEIP
jgi:peptidyl-tRNA hydrolase